MPSFQPPMWENGVGFRAEIGARSLKTDNWEMTPILKVTKNVLTRCAARSVWLSLNQEPPIFFHKSPSCAIILGRPTSPGAPGGLHTWGSLPLAQPKPRPLGKPFAPRGSPARGLAWRSPPRGGSPPWGADLPPPVPARVPAPQFPQQSPSPSPSPAPLFEYTQRPPASPTR